MTFNDAKASVVEYAKSNVVVFKILAVISVSHLLFELGENLLINKDFGLYKALLVVLLVLPKNLLASFLIKRIFIGR